MVNTKELIYKKAHVELYEVIKRLSQEELEKIPQNFIDNLKNSLDTEYEWNYDDQKSLEEQDFLVETKALLVEMYERYLCPEDKKEFWNKYDRICLNIIEEKKREKYNTNNIFKNNKVVTKTVPESINNLPTEIKDNLFKKVIKFFKRLFNNSWN